MKKTILSTIVVGFCSTGLLLADCTGGDKPQCTTNSDCSTFSAPYPINCTSGYGNGNTSPSTETMGSNQVDLMTYNGGNCVNGSCSGGAKTGDQPDTTQPYIGCGICGA